MENLQDIKELSKIESRLEKIIHFSLFAYLFLLIFPHVTTLREIVFWSAVLFWLILRSKRREPFVPLNPITVSLSLFMAIALIASIAGIEPLENIRRFKGELLKQFLLFLIAATEYSSIEKIKKLFIPLVTAFALYTIFVIIESFEWGFPYYWDQTLRHHFIWLDGYSKMCITLLPLTLGYFLLITTNLRFLLLILMLLEFAIMATYRDVTVFGGIISVILLGALFARPQNQRLWIRAFIIIVILISTTFLYTHKDNPAIIEYKTKLYLLTHPLEEFKKPGGFSNRVPMWKAAIEVIKDRPLIGYGWGMKKYPRILDEKKYLNKWKTEKPELYNLYINHKDAIPPHNIFLEIALQSGLFGLISFFAFIGIYLIYLIKASIKYNSDIDRNFFIIIVGGILSSFIVVNLFSDALGGISQKVLFVVLGAGAAWMNSKPR